MIAEIELARQLYADALAREPSDDIHEMRLAAISAAAQNVASAYTAVLRRFVRPVDSGVVQEHKEAGGSGESMEHHLCAWAERIIEKKKGRGRRDLLIRVKRYVLPYVSARRPADVHQRDILSIVQSVEVRSPRLAHSVLRDLTRFYRHMVLTGVCVDNPAAPVRAFLRQPKSVPYRYPIDTDSAARLIHAIRSYKCRAHSTTGALLRLAPMVFLRPVELRTLRWAFVDLDAATIAVPSHLMKSGRPHVIPLARQAVELLRSLEPITGKFEYLFNGGRGKDEPVSYSTLNRMLRSIGFARVITPHSFRTLASSWLNEQGWNPDAIERQLSHFGGGNRIRKFYNRAQHLEERRRMMQAWADHLDALERRGKRLMPTGGRPPQGRGAVYAGL